MCFEKESQSNSAFGDDLIRLHLNFKYLGLELKPGTEAGHTKGHILYERSKLIMFALFLVYVL